MDWVNQRSRLYWYDQYALNEQETAFARYDPDRIAAELVGVGVDIVTVYAANQYGIAYYPSAILPQHPNLGGRDYVGDLVTRLRAHDKRVILYINWLDSKHPEWNMVPLGCHQAAVRAPQQSASWADPSHPNGRVQALPGGAWQVPCINSPRAEQVASIAREIVDRYHPDGFHLDMFSNGDVCVCDYCRPTLERICGTADITREVIREHWVEFIDWRCGRSAAVLSNVSAVLRERGIVAAHNPFAPLYVAAIWGQDEAWLDSLDVFLSECFDRFLAPCSDLNSTSINVRWQHAVGKPAWIIPTQHPIHYAHWPISQVLWEVFAAACKANGCKAFGPCGVGTRPDTTTSPKMLANVRHGFDFYMRDADLDDNAVSAAKIALVFSWATRKYFGAGDQQWLEEFSGWARLLIEEHLPYDIVAAERIGDGADLKQYDLVILPNSANLSDRVCRALRDYVRRGGRVLATAETSLWDGRGGRRTDFALADALGISWRGSVAGHFAVQRPDEAEPASGVFQQVASRGKTIAHRVDVDPAGSVAGTKDPLPVQVSDWPVVVVGSFGEGETCYVAFDIGRYFSMHGDEHIGAWMAELLDAILPARQVAVQAPRTVEVTVWRQTTPERTIIHLANRTVAWTLPTDARQITEIIPVHDIEVTIDKPYHNSVVTARGADVKARADGDKLVAHVAVVQAYAAIVIEASSPASGGEQ
ncbi:MAG: beta-galactosidase trimerization domain-containing protein [Armatimonadota bacterium]|nr:MAG: beta-galactosidase trimerization domain-containing protein [Armatimonadota bacterium]